MISKIKLCLTGIVMFTFASTSQAQLGHNLFMANPKATSLGNAVTADPPGIDSIHFNPAGLTRLKGRQVELKLSAIDASVTGSFIATNEYEQYLEAHGRHISEDPLANHDTEIEKAGTWVPGIGFVGGPLTAAVPTGGGISYTPPGSRFTFATGVMANLAGGLQREKDDPASVYIQEAGLTRFTYFSPSLGFRVTERLSLGASIGFSYFGVGLKLPARISNYVIGSIDNLLENECDPNASTGGGLAPFVSLCGGDIDVLQPILDVEANGLETYMSTTFNLGVLWQATDWLTLGMVYQSPAKDRLEGDIKVGFESGQGPGINSLLQGLKNGNGLLDPLLGLAIEGLDLPEDGMITSSGHIDLDTPAHFAVGASAQITPAIKVNVDAKWSETSVYQELAFRLDENIPVLQLLAAIPIEGLDPDGIIIPLGFEDTTSWALGIEYTYSDRLDLRFGFEPRQSGIPEDKRSFLVPLGDTNLYSTGFSYKLTPDSIVDFALAYFDISEYIKSGTSTNGNYPSGNLENFIYNPSAGLDTQMDMTVVMMELGYRAAF